MSGRGLICAGVAALALTACETEVKDGKIPEKFVEAAQSYTGTYRGELNGAPLDITLRLEGDVAVLDVSRDLLRESCGSSVGALRWVGASGNDKNFKLKAARFEFDAGRCRVDGDLVNVLFLGKGKVRVSILDRYWRSWTCANPPPRRFDPEDWNVDFPDEQGCFIYLEGELTRVATRQ